MGDEIGSGNFGVVYRGVWHNTWETDQAAIKTLHNEASEEDKIKLLREAAIIHQFLHDNIMKLHGVVTSGERVSNS